ncbi:MULTISPECIES: hypothetical protein [Serratia]|uniref:hypothetical protein n=1 Tax=Serratia TaxID=613 RepID=UPI0010201AAE|nr:MULTISPECIES: hypothetical protein [Serratia]TXE64951.1 hypothetical protein FOT59_25725 [Serratia nevei]
MATLFIDLLIKPRKRFRVKTTSQDELTQRLVLYVQRHYLRVPGWELYKYGRSWGCLCQVVPLPFLDWLSSNENCAKAKEIAETCRPFFEDGHRTVVPPIAVYIPLSWLCIIIPPLELMLREHWQTQLGTTQTVPDADYDTSLKPSDYYLLCEGRAIPDVWQRHYELCMKRGMPFIVLWHFPPKQARFSSRYDILFSWETLVKSHSHVFDNPDCQDITTIVTKRIMQLLRERRDEEGFERVSLQNVLGEGQINILKLSFNAAEKLTLDLIQLIGQLIIEVEVMLQNDLLD